MDLKWIAVGLIFAVATFVYARTMRVHAHANWSEIVFPWRRRSKVATSIETTSKAH
jgi:hypothetical protein